MFHFRTLVYAIFVLLIFEIKPIIGKISKDHHGGSQSNLPSKGPADGRKTTSKPPPRKATLPPRNTTLPPRNTTLPPRNTTLPPRNTTLPPRNTTLPPRNTTLPPRNTTLPPRNTTLPSRNTSTPNINLTILVHNEIVYDPPAVVKYTPPGGGVPMTFPVYHGTPPTYVYQYIDSESKYGILLTGLALLNLGNASSHRGSGGSSSYKGQPGDICKFAVKKDNGDYEEVKINCQLISSFIYQEQAKTQSPTNTNTTITTTTVTNVTVVNNTDVPQPAPPVTSQLGNIIYSLLPNGTLIHLNGTNINGTVSAPAQQTPNNTITSSMTVSTITTNTTVVDALNVKGKPVEVTPGMQCFVIRLSPTGNMRKSVPCCLLISYVNQSLKRDSAVRNVPVITVLAVVMTACLVY